MGICRWVDGWVGGRKEEFRLTIVISRSLHRMIQDTHLQTALRGVTEIQVQINRLERD